VPAARAVIAVTLYSRPGCHLCDEMKRLVTTVSRNQPVILTEIDISADPDLERQYGLEIPVLVIDGRKAAKYRVTEETLRRLLLARSQEAR
jgi:glutaredoxin